MSKQPSNSQQLFRTPFSPSYWRCAAGELKSTKMLVIAALFIAIRVAVDPFFIPWGDGARISVNFIFAAIGAMIYGPVIGAITGAIVDVLGFSIAPSGAFFPGYVLSAMLGSFVYGLFLYRARVSVVFTALRIILAKIVVNVFINIGLGTLWMSMMTGKGYWYYLSTRALKNLIMLPIEIVVLIIAMSIVTPIAIASRIIPKQPGNKNYLV